MRKAFFLTLAFSVVPALYAGASRLSPEKSLERALTESRLCRVAPATAAEYRLAYSGLQGGVYLFDNPSGKGYIVTSGSDSYPALLGYSDSGRFDAADAPPAFLSMLEAFDSQIAAGVPVPEGSVPGYSDISPLVSSKWDQKAPYNNLTPVYQGEHTLTGCVATAMAQVVRFWEYPAVGTGEVSYYWGLGDETLSYDFSSVPFDYAAMLDVYDDSATETQKNAVAQLMLACGMASNMDYSDTFSGAGDIAAAAGIVSHLGYNAGLRLLFRDFYRVGEWSSMVYGELAAGRPVLYYGFSPAGGHAFICDGYSAEDGGLFHFNWGWSGASDGFYRINALDPAYLGSGATATGFNRMQSALFGVHPSATQDPEPVFDRNMLCFGYFTIGKMEYSRKGNVLFGVSSGLIRRGYYNMSIADLTCRLGVKFVPVGGGEAVYAGATGEQTFAPGATVDSFNVPGEDFPAQGSYVCMPAYNVGGVWYEMPQELGMKTRLVCEIDGQSLKFSVDDDSDRIVVDRLEVSSDRWYVGDNVEITATVSSRNLSDEDTDLTPALLRNGYIMATLPARTVRVEDDETASLVWTVAVSDALEPGGYDLGLLTGKTLLAGSTVPVSVINAEETLRMDVTEVRINRKLADAAGVTSVAGTKLSFAAKMECVAGFLDGEMNVAVYDNEDNFVKYVAEDNKPLTMNVGDTRSVSFSGDIDGCFAGREYKLALWNVSAADNGRIGQYYRVTFADAPASVEEAMAEAGTPLYYNLQGMPVDAPAKGSVVIVRQGARTRKALVR